MAKVVNPKQEEALMYLAQGYTQKKVAELVGVTPQTINAWIKEPKVIKKLEEYTEEMNTSYLSEIHKLRTLSLRYLAEIIEEGTIEQKFKAINIVNSYIFDSSFGLE